MRANERRRAPSLADSPDVREVDNQADLGNLQGMTVAEMLRSLASLEEEKDEIGRRMSGPVSTFEKKVEKQREEKEYEVICRLIARIKAELKAKEGERK
jgi:hypothetical protein